MKTALGTLALTIALTAPVFAPAQGPGQKQAPAKPRLGSRFGAAVRNAPAVPPASLTPVPTSGAGMERPAGAPGARPGQAPQPGAPSAPQDPGVTPVVDQPPEPTPIDQLQGPTIPLPNVPIDPYLLRKENGPFMVTAYTFRGPDATRYALALILELRNSFGLPAYLFHLKIQPGGSNIRNVQPTADAGIPIGSIAPPEKYRIYDEAAVLVGNCKTIDEAETLMRKVKKLHPKTLDGLPNIWNHRKGQGLKWAMVTQNPLQAAQNLYPGSGNPHGGSNPGQGFDPSVAAASFQQNRKPDPLIKQINGGPHNIFKCPGPYTLPVAEFTGRATTKNDPKFTNPSFLKQSPLATAADDAEQLASKLAKCKSLDPACRPFVYHTRTSSMVCIGAFNGPNDPRLLKLRGDLPKVVTEMLTRKMTEIPLAPSTELMPVPRP